MPLTRWQVAEAGARVELAITPFFIALFINYTTEVSAVCCVDIGQLFPRETCCLLTCFSAQWFQGSLHTALDNIITD